ncbi:hypothetical protein ZIOFF_058884 [Zingiber officinale]|uniref:RING-CH-type domain-containing protein n=1 Tax=Zingiber officinale TaxID=94328 RepID=A0A8J5KMA0_ZINOF|nr:hypothetical protein ZIOFF_058884 [Zingiber officinale]
MNHHIFLLLSPVCVESAMKKRKRDRQAWNPLAPALGLSRDCVQRWCDEKGSNVCEICLQTFEPGYTFSEKKALADVVVTIRLNHDPEILSYNEEDNGETGHNYEECSTSSQRGATFCRSVAIMLTVMLLVRHFFAVMMLSSGQYAFGILTVSVCAESLWDCDSILRRHEVDSNGSESTTAASSRATPKESSYGD